MADYVLYQEAAFPKESIGKVLKNYISLLEKRTGLKISGPKIPYVVTLTKNLKGMKFLTSNKKAFRFNWRENELISASVWIKPALDPHYTLNLAGLNAVEVVSSMEQMLSKKESKDDEEDVKQEDSYPKSFTEYWFEATNESEPDFEAYKKSKAYEETFEKTNPTIKKLFRGYNTWAKAHKKGRLSYDQVKEISEGTREAAKSARVTKGKAGINIVDEYSPEAVAFLKTIGLKPGERQAAESVFQQIEQFTELVIKGKRNALIVAGDPGLGKCVVGSTKIRVIY